MNDREDIINKLFLELSGLATVRTKRESVLEDLLISAHAIAERRGVGTSWDRFCQRLRGIGIGHVTPRTFKVLPGEKEEN